MTTLPAAPVTITVPDFPGVAQLTLEATGFVYDPDGRCRGIGVRVIAGATMSGLWSPGDRGIFTLDTRRLVLP